MAGLFTVFPGLAKGHIVADYRVTDDGGDRLRARARDARDSDGSRSPAIGDQLRCLCTSAASELHLQGVAITVMTEQGDASAASVGPQSRSLQELQFAGGGGPSRDAFDAGKPVLVPDLSGADGRWPVFARDALDAGVWAAYAIPLQLGAVRFGVLTCYSVTARTLTSPELSQLLIYAEVATDLLLDGAAPAASGSITELVATVGLRSEVFQAQGMVAADLHVGLAEALARMRGAAFLDGVGLHDLAEEILGGQRMIPRASADEPLSDDA